VSKYKTDKPVKPMLHNQLLDDKDHVDLDLWITGCAHNLHCVTKYACYLVTYQCSLLDRAQFYSFCIAQQFDVLSGLRRQVLTQKILEIAAKRHGRNVLKKASLSSRFWRKFFDRHPVCWFLYDFQYSTCLLDFHLADPDSVFHLFLHAFISY
jgi:hypothetical protein